ncbi:hypothetical protein [Halomonas lysinitropha]|uniref:Uncharacterized protein n=1 Tax=Halomonas lysinitropha TaxID=2607506 RepID=A0A5K1I4T1_9GAMM|nr:hypothetical protein [Halomonas lysinitropha]VVZ96486.1 hypothetical protein HALO32_02586 [Halomonas lysinitropha]
MTTLIHAGLLFAIAGLTIALGVTLFQIHREIYGFDEDNRP